MKPYYEHAGITIYHGNSRGFDLLGLRGFASAVVSDPPYGVSLNTKTASSGRHNGAAFGLSGSSDMPEIVGDAGPFDPSNLLRVKEVILWGANHYASRLPDCSRWLVWDKRCGGTPDDNSDCEMAWCRSPGPARIHRQVWRGFFREGAQNAAISGAKLHPAQKPLDLMQWCVGFTRAETIIDPYMGSGTTLVAAKNLGRKAIGIEIEEKYCEIAAKRLSQEVFSFSNAVDECREEPNALLPS